MTLSELSIRRPVFAWMLMAALIIFGAIGFNRMGISSLPDVDFPVITVSLTLDGAAPETMETDIVDVVEDAVMGVEGVKAVSSSSMYGSATITIEFELNRNIDVALQDVQSKIAQAQRMLPREMDPPVITKTNPEDQPIIWLTLSSDQLPLKDLMTYTRDYLKDQFSTVPGVGDVFMGGYIDPNLRVWVDPKKLSSYELTVGDIISTIQSEHSEVPGGGIETSRKQFNVRTLGEATTPEDFGLIVVNSRGGMPNYTPIRLNQVSKIEEGLAEIRRMSRFLGKPAVGLGIRKQRGANAVEVARAAKKKMAELNKTMPKTMSLGLNFDSTKFIEDSVNELNFTLLLSALLTAVVCWLFLGSWTATLNILLAIPTSIVGAFIALYFFGFTLNTFTLLGLSLAIGIVVDDAIMVLENIIRHAEKGESRMMAALVGSREIAFAAMAATVAIVAIFLPVAFMKGIIGKYFFQFGVTMTVAVLLSLLEALTLTPMRCSRFVNVEERTTRIGRAVEFFFHKLAELYRWGLGWALENRWKVVIGALAFFFLSVGLVRYVNKEFSPAQDMGVFLIRMQTPVGSSLPFTDSKFREAEKILALRSEIERYYVAVGGFTGNQTNTGIMFITMKDKGKRGIDSGLHHEMTQQEFMAYARGELSKIPDVKVVMQDLSLRGFTASRGFPIEFTVRGPDWDKLGEYSQEIMKRMEKTELMMDIDTDYLLGMPEIQITPDRTKAASRGVSVATIGQTVNAMIGGVLVGRYPKNGHRYDIRVQLPKDADHTEEISRLMVRNNRGEIVPLGSVVDIREKPSLQQISRYSRERAISVFANVKPGVSQQKALDQVAAIGAEILPAGYRIQFSGSAEAFTDAFNSLVFAMVLGIIVAYMVLASQFNSFIDPVTVLMALPFSVSGALISLLLSRQSLNIYSLIGLILLMGIVKKNSILLVDFTNQVRDRGGKSVRDALLEACPIRLRPILMTSFATIAGAIPPALAIGPGAETRVPMAIAVIGGVLVSTFLTLFVVPCVYLVLSRFGKRDQLIAEQREIDLAQSRSLATETTH